jgi:hypothetical protein
MKPLLSLPKNDPGQADADPLPTRHHPSTHRKNSKYGEYEEAWHLLMAEP